MARDRAKAGMVLDSDAGIRKLRLVHHCRCSIKDCGEDGIVAQDRARVDLEACRVTACKGPALDLTHQAQAFVTDSALTGCAGDVLLPLPLPLPVRGRSGTHHDALSPFSGLSSEQCALQASSCADRVPRTELGGVPLTFRMMRVLSCMLGQEQDIAFMMRW